MMMMMVSDGHFDNPLPRKLASVIEETGLQFHLYHLLALLKLLCGKTCLFGFQSDQYLNHQYLKSL